MNRIVAVLLFVVLVSGAAYAEEGKFAVSARAGTLGAGLEGTMRLNPKLNARVGAQGLQFDYNSTEAGIEYDLDIELLSFSTLLDWFPFGNGFRLTGGIVINQNELEANAKPTGTYTVGDTTYTAAQVGTLTGAIDFDDVAGYAGIGWGNPFGKDKKWSITIDAGVMFQGEPDVSLSANGTLAGNAAFLAELAKEEQDLQNELSEYEFYPVVMVGVTYKF